MLMDNDRKNMPLGEVKDSKMSGEESSLEVHYT